jgi:hypothetical protein
VDHQAVLQRDSKTLLELSQKQAYLNELIQLREIEATKLARQKAVRDALEKRTDPLQDAEDALKALLDARDTDSSRKAAEKLEKALTRLREQRKKEPDRGSP